jgi:membrane peptidoglycan carboxypeptidase
MGMSAGAGYPHGPQTRGPGGRLPPGRPAGGGAGGGNGGGGRFIFSADWWRHWTWRKALAVAASCFGGMITVGAIGVGVAYAKTPIPDPQAAAMQQSSIVYFSNGKTEVGQFGSTDRQRLTINQIPELVRNAVVAAEDKNFYHEGGISPTGIIRAAYYDLTNSSGSLQGGSTITQQLVRNFYADVGTAQTLSRKIKEIFVAQKLAQVKSKAWILEQYLNTVYFGNHAYGIGAASQAYFGVPLTKLNPAQAAMLAALIQSPSYYSPDPKAGAAYQGLVSRWHYVLDAMVKMGALSQQVADQQKFPKVVKRVNNSWAGYRGYIMQAVQYELLNTYHYTQEQIDNGGLRITTTFSKHLMDSLYATVRSNERLMRRGAPPGGAVTTSTGLPRYVRIGAMLEQPGTGAILAMYSGQNYNKSQYDNALQSRNQVGSSFKPYVLATAVRQGMSVQKSTLNGYAPLWIPPDSQPLARARLTRPASYRDGWYKVTNDEIVNSQGPVSVVKATAESLNTAYTDLWHRVALNTQTGAHNVVDMAKAFGVDTRASGMVRMRDEAGTALGQSSLTVEEQATFIATLAAGGEYSTPHVIKQIQLHNTVVNAKVAHRQVLTPGEAADVDYALSFDFSPMGTAHGLGLTNGQTVIAKTGTTNLSQQAFFMAATQRDAFAIGMFVNKPGCHLPASDQYLCTSQRALSYAPPPGLQTLFGVGGLAGYGGQWPALMWHSYFMKEFNSLPPIAWPGPNNDGTAWNMIGQRPKPKPKPKPIVLPPGCRGHGHKVTCPTPTPTATATATATPTPTVTCSTGPGPTQCTTSSPTPTAGAATTLDYTAEPLAEETRSWTWWLGSG